MNRKHDKNHPDTAKVKFHKARALSATKQKKEALKYIKQAIKIGKKYKTYWLERAEILLKEIKAIP